MQQPSQRPTWLPFLAGAVAMALLVLFVMALTSDDGGGDDRGDDAPSVAASFDPTTGDCVGGDPVSTELCKERVARVQSTLKNAATAEESHAVEHRGAYTDEIADLEAQGLQLEPDIILTIVEAEGARYCLEATSDELGETLHYDSDHGTVRPGPCS